ncbi:MAG: hypothetical protein ACR2NH_08560 [Solirubrobacteraceae bacterium]
MHSFHAAIEQENVRLAGVVRRLNALVASLEAQVDRLEAENGELRGGQVVCGPLPVVSAPQRSTARRAV